MNIIPLNEQFVLIAPEEYSRRVLEMVYAVVSENSEFDLIVFDYYLQDGAKKSPVAAFVNRYSILERYCNIPYMAVKTTHFLEGLSRHLLALQVLAKPNTRIKEVHIPCGVISKEKYYDIQQKEFVNINCCYFSKLFPDKWHTIHTEDDKYRLRIRSANDWSGSLGLPKPHIIILSSTQDLLERCLESMRCDSNKYIHVGLFTDDSSFLEWAWRQGVDVIHIPRNQKFNFSKFNNMIFDKISDKVEEHVILLNDDTEMIDDNSINALAVMARYENADIVGAELLYPHTQYEEAKYQHGGVHFKDTNDLFVHYGRHRLKKNFYIPSRQVSAVTFACTLIKKNIFVNYRLDEKLYGDCNDIDFCYRVARDGGRIWYCNESSWIHHESFTRRKDPEMQNDHNSRTWYLEHKDEISKVFRYL